MRIVVGTGTDVGCVGLGDSALLAPMRERKGHDIEKVRDDAVASGALWLSETGADGGYLVHLYVDEEPPADVARYLEGPIVIERLCVPSGKLIVAGEECLSGALSLEKHPHMGSVVQVAPGEYQMTAFRGDAPEEVIEAQFETRTTAEERKAWSIGNRLTAMCVLGTLAALFLGYFVYVRTASIWTSLIPVIGAVAPWAYRTRYCASERYRRAERIYRSIEQEFPSIAVVLRKRTSAQEPGASATGR